MGGMKKLEKHAREQLGLVTRAQVDDAFGSRSSIAWKVETGELARVHELVFRLRGVEMTWERRAQTGLLIGGKGSALSHHSAALLHGLDGFHEPRVIDVTVIGDRRREFAGVRFHRTRISPGASVIARNLEITSVQRTIVDLAGILEEEPFEKALDSANRRYVLFQLWLDDYMKQLKPKGTPGLMALKMLLALRRGGGTDSPLEVRVLRKLRELGLKHSEEPIKVYDRNGHYVIRLDFAWPELKVGIHVDSYLWHHQRERFDRDARQRSRLTALGWRCVIVTNNTFKDGSWLEDLLAILDPQSRLTSAASATGF